MRKYYEPWKYFAEKLLWIEPPSCPSKQELMLIESYLDAISKKNRKPEVLMLGCTFNYRKLLAKKGIPADMADLSREMFKINTGPVKNMKRNEKFIHKNWITMDLGKKYDLILGDFVISNIPQKYKKKFYNNIKKHMKEDGLFITRVYWQRQKLLNKEQIYRKYKNKKITRKRMMELWWDAIFNLGVDMKKRTVDNSIGWKEIKDYGRHNHMRKWIDTYKKKIPTEPKEWSVLRKDEQDKEIRENFRVIKM